MSDLVKIKLLEDEIERLAEENAALKRENQIVAAQLKLKDRHLNILLNFGTIALSAFGPDGMMLNTGKGLDIPLVDSDPYKSAFIGYSLEQLESIMPHVIKAVRVSFKEKIVTRAESTTPSGKIFHVILVPYINDNKEVEYVYALSMRWPESAEIDQEHFYKGALVLPVLE